MAANYVSDNNPDGTIVGVAAGDMLFALRTSLVNLGL